jgi:hypothetical protein
VKVTDHWHDVRMSHRRAVVAVCAFASAFAVLAVTALVIERIEPVAAPTPTPAASKPRLFACAMRAGDDADYCLRLVQDDSRRTAVTEQTRTDLSGVAHHIDKLLNPAPVCRAVQPTAGGPATQECDRVLPEPAVLLARLDDAGYPGAVVRTARDGDPAPVESLFYAVPVRGACIVGAVTGLPERVAGRVTGTLPGGGCD